MAVLLRILDILGALVGILLTAPIMLITALAILVESGRPIFFVQNRVGRNNQIFRMYKFRSMYVGTPEVAKDQLKEHMEAAVTRVGRFIRRTSIDELPQLFNVLKGDMSIVGPRPALYSQVELVQMRTELGIHTLRPGLTGLAQINGREELSLEQKVEYDHALLLNYNLRTYLQVITRTFRVLLRSKGAY